MSAGNLYAETVIPHGHGTTPTSGQAMPQLEEQYGMVTSPRIPRVAIRHGATEDGRAEDGHRTTDGIAGRSALEARSLHGDGAVVPLAGQRFLHTARSLHGDGAVVAPALSGV